MLSTRSLVPAQVLRRAILRPATMVVNRDVSTATITAAGNQALLDKQRAARPNSPWHIYQPQLTSLSSIANRVTGTGLSVGMYAVFLGHLILPAVGVPFDSATLVSVFADLPEWFKLSAKAIVGLPFCFHNWNGLRHLAWDMGYLLDLKTSYAAGYTVIGLSVASTVGLLML